MAKGSIQIPKIIKAMETAITKAYPEIGKDGIRSLVANEEESDTTGRLSDSFSWATKDKSSGVGSRAAASDVVPNPTDNAMIIGTQCPYATSVDKGTTNQRFAYGQNGNPTNFEALKAAIHEWIRIKVAKGTFQGDINPDQDLWGLAHRIAKDIEENGTDAHPFWEESKKEIIAIAKRIMVKSFSTELSKIKDATQEIGVKK